jgi:sugar phosphate permease
LVTWLGELLLLGQFQMDDEDAVVGYLLFEMALLVAALVSGWVIFGPAAA